MKITWRTRTRDVLPLLNQERLVTLMEKIPVVEYKSLISMTISEFGSLIMDENEYIENNIILKNKRFLECFGKIKHLRGEIDNLNKFIGRYNRTLTNEEKAAQRGIFYPNFVQRMLIDLVEFFHLRSFDEAEKMLVSDWLLVFQNKAADALYSYNYSKILDAKAKRNNNRKKK